MDPDDRIAEILGAWRERFERGEYVEPAEVVRDHREIAPTLSAQFRIQELVDEYFDGASEQDPFAPPPRLGDYRIVREIGRGGMGVVYEAEQTSMSRRVALKVLFPTIGATASTRRRFEREARVTGRLHHTNIVTVHAMGQENGYLYFAMELVEGEPLDRVLLELQRSEAGTDGPARGVAASLIGRAAPRRIAAMFAGVADALHVAHGQGVIHRDVKPSNLVLDEEGILKLTDFGLAHLTGEGFGVTRTGEIIGTPLYMSPEQVRARRDEVDPRTDVYSLGVTLYEFLSRTRPYDGDDVATLCSQILSVEPPSIRNVAPNLPSDLAVIVHKALEKEPGDRYASAGAMARDLRAFAERRSIQARPPSLLRKWTRRARRHKVRTGLGAAVLLLAALAGVFFANAADERLQRETEEARRLEREYEDLLSQAQADWPPLPFFGPEQDAPLARAIELRPDAPDAYLVRSFQGDQPAARRAADLEAAAARGLAQRLVAIAGAWHLLAGRRTEEAERVLARVQDEESLSALEQLLLGQIARHRGHREEAIDRLRLVMRRADARPAWRRRASLELASLYESNGEYERAIEYLSAASPADERPIVDVLHLASLWDRTGNTSRAAQEFDRLLGAVRPEDGFGVWKALLEIAEVHCRPAWILEIADQGIAQHPEAPDLHYWRAMGLRRLHRLDEALAATTKAETVTKPSHNLGPILHMRAKLFLDLGRFEEAHATARRATVLVPNGPGPWITLSVARIMTGRADEAVQPAAHAVRVAPGTFQAHEALAHAHLACGAVDQALPALARAHAIEPAQVEIARLYAATLAGAGRIDEAVEVLDHSAACNPTDMEPVITRYWTLAEAGRLEEARAGIRVVLEHAERVLRASPDSAPHLALKGIALRCLEKPREALIACDASLALDDSVARVWFEKAYTHEMLGDSGAAIEAYREAVARNPHYAVAWGNLAALLHGAGEPDEALRASDQVLRLTTDPGTLHGTHHNRGLILKDLKRFEEARAAFHKALGYRPGDPDTLGGLGDLEFEAGRYAEAARAFELAVRADENAAHRWHWWALSHIRAGNTQAAHDVLAEGLARHPEAPDLATNWAVLHLLHPEFPDTRAAVENWVRVLPKSRQAWAAKGQFHNGREEWDEAIACATKALAIDANDPSSYETRARAYANKKEYGKAKQEYESMLGCASGFPGGLVNAGWFLATAGDASLRDPERGLSLITQGLQGLATQGRHLPIGDLMLGWARLRAGQAAQAIEPLQAALADEDDPHRGTALYGLAAAYARTEHPEEARSYLERAERWLDAHPDDRADIAQFREEARAAVLK